VSFAEFSFQQVGPKAGTPGVAQDGTAPPAGGAPQGAPPGCGGGLGAFFPLLLFIPLLFMMFRKQKKEQESRSKLKKGDQIVSNSGLIGELVDINERVAKVKIAPGTTVQMLANSVSPMPAEPASSAADKELKDAKPVSDKK
jgi:preprotein translocase subunit YajC